MGLGLLIGATVVGFGTDLADLALMGALTGLPLGIAQAMALPARSRFRWVWAAVMPLSGHSAGPSPPWWAWTSRAVHGLRIHRCHHRLRPDRSRPPVHRPVRHHRRIHRHPDRGLVMTRARMSSSAPARSVWRSGIPAPARRGGPDGQPVRAAPRARRSRGRRRRRERPGVHHRRRRRAPPSVYQTLNPPYAQWVELFPGLQAGVLAAAEAAAPGWSAWRTSTCTDVPQDRR